ncbi:MAG: energy transducer TonB [Bdellovibrionota bacterium]
MGEAAKKYDPQPQESKPSPMPWAAMLVSLLFHVLVLLFLGQLSVSSAKKILPGPQQTPIRKVVWNTPPDEGKIVDLAPLDAYETSEKVESSYLSDRNRRVPKEQQARSTGVPTESTSRNSPNPKTSKYSLNLSDQELLALQKEKDLLASPSSPSNYLPEIQLGDETLLNTKSFAFSNYFVRMKRQIEGYWSPVQYLHRLPSLRNQYVTLVTIILDEKGYLVSQRVSQSSGFDFLDREATDSVQKASPFLNPPKDLLDENLQIRVPFSFIVVNSFQG